MATSMMGLLGSWAVVGGIALAVAHEGKKGVTI